LGLRVSIGNAVATQRGCLGRFADEQIVHLSLCIGIRDAVTNKRCRLGGFAGEQVVHLSLCVNIGDPVAAQRCRLVGFAGKQVVHLSLCIGIRDAVTGQRCRIAPRCHTAQFIDTDLSVITRHYAGFFVIVCEFLNRLHQLCIIVLAGGEACGLDHSQQLVGNSVAPG
jgi:hypothetical protein